MNFKLHFVLIAGLVSAVAGVSSCGQLSEAAAQSGTALGIDPAAMDKAVKPGDDFYAYANGAWMKTAEIPADRASIGGFVIADQQTEKQLGELMSGILKSDAAGTTDEGRIRDYYRAFLDTAAIEQAGLAPIKPELDRFAAIADRTALSRALGEQVRADVDPLNATNFFTENLFGVFVTQALAGGEVMPYILQGGLGMPEREYYLSADAKMADLRAKYQAYIAQVHTEAGIPDAPTRAKRIFDLEMKIAQAHASREEPAGRRAKTGKGPRPSGRAPTSPARRLESTGTLSSRRRSSATSSGLRSTTRSRSPGCRRSLLPSRWRRGRTG